MVGGILECYCYLRNIKDQVSDGKTPCERRFGVPKKGPIIPFGAMVEYHPISAKDLSRMHQFGSKVLPGTFFGYTLHAERIWKGDIMSQTLRNWKRWTHLKSMQKDSMRTRLEKCAAEDYWNIDGDRELLDTWTGFTRITFWMKIHQMDIHGPGRN